MNLEISQEILDRLINESIGAVELGDAALKDKATKNTLYTFDYPPCHL